MRSIGRQVSKERLFIRVVLLRFDPAQGFLKENIRAILVCLFELPVVFDDGVEISGARCVALITDMSLTDPAGTVNKDFIEPAIFWLVRIRVPQVPFTKNARRVTG